MKPQDANKILGQKLTALRQMKEDITAKRPVDRPEWQIKAYWSNTNEGFYVVLAYGFPCNIYVKHLNRWLGAENSMVSAQVQHTITPLVKDIEVVTPEILLDIYRRGVVGLVKHRIMGGVKG